MRMDALTPSEPVYLIGHDYGAQIYYPAMAPRLERFAAAALLAGAHPGLVQWNARPSFRSCG